MVERMRKSAESGQQSLSGLIKKTGLTVGGELFKLGGIAPQNGF